METPTHTDGDPRATTNFLLGLRQALAPRQERGGAERQIADHCAMGALAVPSHLAAAEERAARFARGFQTSGGFVYGRTRVGGGDRRSSGERSARAPPFAA